MSDKPEALRLAESAHLGYRIEWQVKAAAELRRLHGIEFALRSCEMALTKMAEKHMDAADRRDELLEALQDLCDTLGECGMTKKARAAIAKATGERE